MADGSTHEIQASGTLLGHPSITAHLVPSFTRNLIGISPILNNGGLGIIKHDKMVVMESNPLVDKIVDFVLSYSENNNLIILTGTKSNGLYQTPIIQPTALTTIHSHHFASLSDMV